MASQRSPDSLSQPTDECFAIGKHNFQEFLPRLKVFLRKSDRSVQFRAAKTLLGPCVAHCSPFQLGKTLLDDAAPVARRLFFETISEVDGLVSSTTFNVLEDVREKLEFCENLLECWLQCLAQLGKFEKLSASQVQGVLDNLVEVIKRSFQHCKTSEETYGDLFEKAKDRLTILFRKTNEVQKLFSVILERVIVFSNDVEAELSALAKVVNFSGETCVLVDGLDMKTVAESWKGFTKLAISYCNELKTFSPPSVTSHLASLADAISSSLSSTVKDSDHRNAERSIKLQKLLLKILHKLCQCYSGHLGNDAASAVVRLLVQLHWYSPACLKRLNIHLGIIDCVEANFTSGTDQLLDSVISDAEFKEAFFKHQPDTESLDDVVGFQFLTLSLVNKLIANSNEAQTTWRAFSHDILEVLFANINALEEELLLGQLSLGNLPLYDSTLTLICGLVASTETVNFPSLEVLLLKYLLGGNFWSSLLASDVWCFVNKYAADSELSYDHLIYLMSVYEMLTNRGVCIENVMLGSLISRLYALTSIETRNRLIDKFEITKARFWSPLKNCISPNDRTFLSELTSTNVGNIDDTWETLNKQPSAQIWSQLISQLTVVGTFGKTKNESVIKTLNTIWNCLGQSIDEFDGIHLYLITQLAIVLLDASQALPSQDEILSPMLSTITSMIPRAVPCLRASVSNYLKDSIDDFASSGPEMKKSLSNLYCNLLEDEDPWSKQEALESFSYLTNASYNEELVIGIVDAVAEVPKISDTVSLYLSESPTASLRGFPSLENYLTVFHSACKSTKGIHACLERGESHRDEKRPKLSIEQRVIARPGTPEDLRERVSKLSDEIDYVLSRKQDMSKSTLNRLHIIVNKILTSNDV